MFMFNVHDLFIYIYLHMFFRRVLGAQRAQRISGIAGMFSVPVLQTDEDWNLERWRGETWRDFVTWFLYGNFTNLGISFFIGIGIGDVAWIYH